MFTRIFFCDDDSDTNDNDIMYYYHHYRTKKELPLYIAHMKMRRTKSVAYKRPIQTKITKVAKYRYT